MMDIVKFLLLGGTIGVVSGALGIGGGVLLVPALMWLFDWNQRLAAGTSLAVLVPPVGLLAAWKAYEHGYVNVQAAVYLACAFAGGAYLGAVLVKWTPDQALRVAFGLLMLFIAVRMLLSADREAASAAAGLVSMTVAWLSYRGLRLLGRRHLPPPPDLGEHIRRAAAQGHGDSDYTI